MRLRESQVVQFLFRWWLRGSLLRYVLLRPPNPNAIFLCLLDYKCSFPGLQVRFQLLPGDEAATIAHQTGESPLAPPEREQKKRQGENRQASQNEQRHDKQR